MFTALLRFFIDNPGFCLPLPVQAGRTIEIIQKKLVKYMENLIKPAGKANKAKSLKKKSFEIIHYSFKISSLNLMLSLLSVNYFLSRTQVINLQTTTLSLQITNKQHRILSLHTI